MWYYITQLGKGGLTEWEDTKMMDNTEAFVIVSALVMVALVGGLGGIWNNWIWISVLVQCCSEKGSWSQNLHGRHHHLSLAIEKFRTSSTAGLFFLNNRFG